jgi:hypothetical protein
VRLARLLALLLCCAAFPLSIAHSQQPTAPAPATPVDPAKVKSIRQLLELTHVAALLAQNMDVSMQNQRQVNPQIPAAFWDSFTKKAHERISELIDSIVPIYARHFSQAEVDQLVSFYATPLGQRLLIEQPAIMGESTDMGRKWGMVLGREVGDSLARAGGH